MLGVSMTSFFYDVQFVVIMKLYWLKMQMSLSWQSMTSFFHDVQILIAQLHITKRREEKSYQTGFLMFISFFIFYFSYLMMILAIQKM